MITFTDMHIHSRYSDGKFSPREIVRFAKQIGLQGICLTDHDTVQGIEEAFQAGRDFGIDVMPGIELSINIQNLDVHILGYGFDFHAIEIVNALNEFQEERIRRAEKIIRKLQENGIPLIFDEVKKIAGDSVMGRPHIADAMVKGGWVKSYEEAFRVHLASWGKAYVPRKTWSLVDSIKLIHKYGGLTSIAHPGLDLTDEILDEIIQAGVDGIEVLHPKHKPNQVLKMKSMVQKNELIETGGSDCHGRNGGMLIGSMKVPLDYFTIIKSRTYFGNTK